MIQRKNLPSPFIVDFWPEACVITYFHTPLPPPATGALVVFIHMNTISAMQKDYWNRLQKT